MVGGAHQRSRFDVFETHLLAPLLVLGELVRMDEARDGQVLAQQVDITAMTRPKLDKAQDILNKLAGYYPAEPPGPSPVK